jgi:hypothetical protein
MNRFMKVSTVLALALVATAATAQAQSANINVTANVFQALTVVGNSNLDFGNVFPGVNKTIGVTDATAGKYSVTVGQAGANVNLSFTLPTDLVGPGAVLLPVGSWTGHWATTDVTSGGTSFTPSAANTAAALSGTGLLFVYIGAQASPGAAQAAGAYTAVATMTVAYF